MALDPSRAGEQIAANDASYDDDPTAELDAPVTCELEEPQAADAGPAPASAAEATVAQPAAPEAPPQRPVAVGSVLRGRYELEAVVGTGGFCTVCRARDLHRDPAPRGGGRVAIKMLREEFAGSASALARLKREFGQLRLLAHPAIVRVFDLDCDDGTWFEVMELLEGSSLSSVLREQRGGTVPAAEAMALLRGCAEALEHVHSRGLVHGDLKPANIFVRRNGEPCLLDFGSVADRSEEASGGARVGTVSYASPQVLDGRPPAPADDVYSLACVAFELLTGRRPFGAGSTPSELGPDFSGLTGVQAAALARGLSAHRSARPASPRAFAAELAAPAEPPAAQAAIPDAAVVQPDSPAVEADAAEAAPAQRMSSRRRLGWLLAGVLLMATAFALIGMNGDTPQSRAGSPALATPPDSAVVAAPAPPDAAAAAPSSAEPVVSTTVTALADTWDAESTVDPTPTGNRERPPRVSTVSFRAASLAVSRRASAAAIELRRDGSGDGKARVAWSVVEDSALAQRDFDGPLSGVEVFAEGQRARTLFIPLVTEPAVTADRSFVVTLDSNARETVIGEPASVRVVIRTPAAMAADARGDR